MIVRSLRFIGPASGSLGEPSKLVSGTVNFDLADFRFPLLLMLQLAAIRCRTRPLVRIPSEQSIEIVVILRNLPAHFFYR